jgi:hypothetical protein
MDGWKVYTYNSAFEQDVFASILDAFPSDDEKRSVLADILHVPGTPTPDVYLIVDTWMRRYMNMTEIERYIAMRPQLRAIEEFLSSHYTRKYTLDIALMQIHRSFSELLGTYRWRNDDYHDHFWTLFFPVINAMYLLTDFEAGIVYGKLPNSLPLVESAEELIEALRDLFLEEIGKVCFKNGIAVGRYVSLREMSIWYEITQKVIKESS